MTRSFPNEISPSTASIHQTYCLPKKYFSKHSFMFLLNGWHDFVYSSGNALPARDNTANALSVSTVFIPSSGISLLADDKFAHMAENWSAILFSGNICDYKKNSAVGGCLLAEGFIGTIDAKDWIFSVKIRWCQLLI